MSNEMNWAGIIVISAICIILGASLIPTLGLYTGTMTDTANMNNYTFTSGANGATIDLIGQELLSTPIVTNKSDGVVINAGNYTIAEGVSSVTGFKTIQYKTNTATYATKNLNVSYNYGAQGYADDSGSRAIVPLIIVFFALLVMTTALVPIFRNGFMEIIGLK